MKHRLIALLTAGIMLLSLTPSGVSAASELVLSADSVSAELHEGGTVLVPVRAEGNPGYVAGTVDVKWDNTALELKKITYDAELAPANSPSPLSDTGKYRLAFGNYLATENFTGNGTFFTLEFEIRTGAAAGNYQIYLTDNGIYSTDYSAIPTVMNPGTVTLTDGSEMLVSADTVSAEIPAAEQIRVPVRAEKNPGYAAANMNVRWNPEALVLKDVEYNDTLAPANSPAEVRNSGFYRACFGDFFATENFTDEGVLFTLVFEAAADAEAGEYTILLEMPEYVDCNIDSVTASLSDGVVKLSKKAETTTAKETTTTTKATTTTTPKVTTTTTTKATTTTTKETTTTTKATTTTTKATTTSTKETTTTTKATTTTTNATTTTTTKATTSTTKAITATTKATTTTTKATTTTTKVTTTTTKATTTTTKATTFTTKATTSTTKATTTTTKATTTTTKATTTTTTKATTSTTKATTTTTTKATTTTPKVTTTTTKATTTTTKATITTTKATTTTTKTTTTTTKATTTTTSKATTTTTTQAATSTTKATTTTTKATTSTTKATTTTTPKATTTTPKVTTTTTAKVTTTTTKAITTTTKATTTTTKATTSTTKATTTTTTKATTTTTEVTTTTTDKATTEPTSVSTTVTTVTTTETQPVEPATDYLRGDVDFNHEVSVSDAQLVLNAYVAGLAGKETNLTQMQFFAADVNDDKQISVDDAQHILIFYVKNTLAHTPTSWDVILGKDTPQTPPQPVPSAADGKALLPKKSGKRSA